MKIRKSSLIYQFLTKSAFGDDTVPTNLCPYMRRFMLMTFFTFLFYLIVVATLASMLHLFAFILIFGLDHLKYLDGTLLLGV